MSKSLIMLVRLYWPHEGGVEKHVMELCGVLRKRGYAVTILTEQFDESLRLKEVHDGVTIIRLPYSVVNNKWKLWGWMLANWRSLVKGSSVVHVHDVFWWILPIKLTNPRLRVVTTFHGYEGNNSPSINAIWWRKLASVLSSRSLCIGDFMAKWYGIKLDLVSYGGVDVGLVKEMFMESKLGSKYLYVGRLSEDAGIMIYLEAMKILREKKNDLVLDICGDGEQRKLAEDYVRENGLVVEFRGWVKNIAERIGESDVVFVSRYLGILEAMNAGKLVVAVYNNQIKHDYLTCHPMAENMIIAGSAKELVQMLESMAVSNMRHMVRMAQAWARQQSWEKMADMYEDMWSH